MSEIHGHEIMRLLHESPRPLTRDELAQEVARRFGESARFHTCSAEGMTLDQLLVFLAERGKVVEQNGALAADIGQMCDHD